jgi:Short C-terminal domain
MRYEGVHPALPAHTPAGVKGEAPADPIAQLKELAALRDAGVLTEDEFVAKKSDILKRV